MYRKRNENLKTKNTRIAVCLLPTVFVLNIVYLAMRDDMYEIDIKKRKNTSKMCRYARIYNIQRRRMKLKKQ